MTQFLRLDYDELKIIVNAFRDKGEDVVCLHSQTRQKVHDLKGEWIGQGADAFFAEMEEELLPALSRLGQALFVGQDVLLKLMKIIQDTDGETAETIKRDVEGEGTAAPGVLGAGAGVSGMQATAGAGIFDQAPPQQGAGAAGEAGTGGAAGTGPVDAGSGVDQGSAGTGDAGSGQAAGGTAGESQFEAAGASEGQAAGGSAGAGGASSGGGGGGGSGGGSRSGGSDGLDGLGGGVGARTEGGAFTPSGAQAAQDHIWGGEAAGAGTAGQPGEGAAGGGAGASIGKEGAAGAAVAGVGAAAAAGVVIKTAKRKKE